MPFGLIVIGAGYILVGIFFAFNFLYSAFVDTMYWGIILTLFLTYGLLSLFLICLGVGLFVRTRRALTFLLYSAFVEFWIGLEFLYFSVFTIPEFSLFGTKHSWGEANLLYAIPGVALILFTVYQYITLTNASSHKWFRSFTPNFRALRSRERITQRVLKGVKFHNTLSFILTGIHIFLLTQAFIQLLTHFTMPLGVPSDLARFFLILGLMSELFLALLIPTLVLLPITAIAALFWQRPTRILILRPFNRVEISAMLKRLIRESVGLLGHVYTLSDSGIRQKWYIRWPVLLPQTWILHFRLKKILKESDIDKLGSRVRRSWYRNINWFSSFSKIFPISCSDSLWQACVQKLLELSDVVLVELTGATTNIMWEIEEIRRMNLINHVVFIVNAEHLGQAQEFFATIDIDAKNRGKLYVYDNNGLQEFESMVIELSRIIERPSGSLGVKKHA